MYTIKINNWLNDLNNARYIINDRWFLIIKKIQF